MFQERPTQTFFFQFCPRFFSTSEWRRVLYWARPVEDVQDAAFHHRFVVSTLQRSLRQRMDED